MTMGNGCVAKATLQRVVSELEDTRAEVADLRKEIKTMQSLVEQLTADNAKLEAEKKESEETLNETLQAVKSMQKAHDHQIHEMEVQFNETISKLCDLEIAAAQSDGSEALHTHKGKGFEKSSAAKKQERKKKGAPFSLRRFFKKTPTDERIVELKQKVRIAELGRRRAAAKNEVALVHKTKQMRKLQKDMKRVSKEAEKLKEDLNEVGLSSCSVCLDAQINCTFLPCGHLCACLECAKKVNDCPICRRHIHKRVKTFKA